MNIHQLQERSHKTAVEHGFWEATKDLPTKILLSITELTEAAEELRAGRAPDDLVYDLDGKPEGFGVELADAMIRIADLATYAGVDLTEMILIKMAYNDGRPHLHGKKF